MERKGKGKYTYNCILRSVKFGEFVYVTCCVNDILDVMEKQRKMKPCLNEIHLLLLEL